MAIEPLDFIAEGLEGFRRLLYISLPLLLALAGFGGYLVAAHSLAPLSAMTQQAEQISGSSLHRRLEVGRAVEELVLLAASFNELLARLDRSFETMRRFVADASHELRTPLAVLRGEAELALAKDRSPQEYRESLTIVQDEARRLGRLVEDLLNLARADVGRVKLRLQDLYLDDLMAECCRASRSQAEARQITLAWHSPDDVSFRGDEELLRRMILNLLDNAIRYTPAGGRVSVSLESRDSSLLLHVEDTGIGMSEEAASHAFERFFRADKARTRDEGGFGLGLSIVKWIAETHGGAVKMRTSPGSGSTFTVQLPA